MICKVKKEGLNKGRLFFCCAQEGSCKYVEWVTEESYSYSKLFKPLPTIKKQEEQYLTKEFINNFANSLKISTMIYPNSYITLLLPVC